MIDGALDGHRDGALRARRGDDERGDRQRGDREHGMWRRQPGRRGATGGCQRGRGERRAPRAPRPLASAT